MNSALKDGIWQASARVEVMARRVSISSAPRDLSRHLQLSELECRGLINLSRTCIQKIGRSFAFRHCYQSNKYVISISWCSKAKLLRDLSGRSKDYNTVRVKQEVTRSGSVDRNGVSDDRRHERTIRRFSEELQRII